MSRERRQHYRVSPNTDRDVSVVVRTESGSSHHVALIDISAGGVALACDAVNALPSKVLDFITVSFESNRLGRPLDIYAQLCHIEASENGESIMYGIRFQNWAEHRENLAPKLRALFNEREAVRVDPREDQDVEVELVFNGKGRISSGLLRDISVLGVGVWINADDEPHLQPGNTIELNVTLPSTDEAIQLQVEIRHLQHVGEQSRLGVEICNPDARARRSQEKNINGYVMERQIEIARIDAERRRAMGSHYPSR